jgi:hypothetical protein
LAGREHVGCHPQDGTGDRNHVRHHALTRLQTVPTSTDEGSAPPKAAHRLADRQRRNLEAYCGRDGEGMVWIVEALHWTE